MHIKCSAQRAQVMVLANAIYFHVNTVQAETFIYIKIEITDTKRCFILINHYIIHQYFSLYFIQERFVNRP